VASACAVDPPQSAPSPLPLPPTSRPAPAPFPPPIPLPPGAPPSVTTLVFQSDPGDPVGSGVSRRYYLGDGQWLAFGDALGTFLQIRVQKEANAAGDFWFWEINFAPPAGQRLAVGTYENARRFGFQPATQPGLSVTGANRSCTTLTGRFVLSELRIGPLNTVDRLVASFDQNCEGASPGLHGVVVVESNPWR
jgi:hypothetical protein